MPKPAGEGAPSADVDGDPKLYTQEQVDGRLSEFRKGLQQENKALKEQLDGLLSWKTDFEAMVKEAAEEAGFDPDSDDGAEGDPPEGEPRPRRSSANPPDVEAIVNSLNKKWQLKFDALQKELSVERDAKKSEKQKALLKDRDILLSNALNKADVIDVVGGMRYFIPETFWDEETEQWLYKTKEGLNVPVEQGILENIPKYLQRTVTTGGAGSRPGTKPKIAELQTGVADLQKVAQQTGKPEDVHRYHVALKELNAANKAAGGTAQPGR